MDIDKVQRLIEVMVENDLVEISIRDGDVEVNLRRPSASSPPVSQSLSPACPSLPDGNPGPGVADTAGSNIAADADEFVEIKSPMVGTFYASADPDAPPFVQSGAKVMPSTVVCLLEAMKVFSEIKAEVSGTIERILVKNAEAVEYGQPLFLVRTA